jgi:uncharacterized membrane protein
MTQQNQISLLQERDTTRLEAFSDGVFAIAITLLVLNIRIPETPNLAQALRGQWPSYLAYLLSFLTILNLWVNHHNIFHYISRTDHWFLFINGLLLLGVCVLPFPTALLAQYFTTDPFTATLVYAGVFTLVFFFPLATLIIYFLLMLFYMLPVLSLPGPEKMYRENTADQKQPEVKEMNS